MTVKLDGKEIYKENDDDIPDKVRDKNTKYQYKTIIEPVSHG